MGYMGILLRRDNAQNWSSVLRTGVFISNSVKPLLTAAILNIAG